MTDHEVLGEKIDALAGEISELHEELPGIIHREIQKHEQGFTHVTPEDYADMLNGRTPEDLIEEHRVLGDGQEVILRKLDRMSEQQEKLADVVLGDEYEDYDGVIRRTGGLQALVIDGEVKTRLDPRDRVAVYVAAIGGVVAIVVATIAALAQIFT